MTISAHMLCLVDFFWGAGSLLQGALKDECYWERNVASKVAFLEIAGIVNVLTNKLQSNYIDLFI